MIAGHRYLLQEVNTSNYKTVVEFLCIEVGRTAFKVKNMISDKIFWIDKSNLSKESWGRDCGDFYIKEDLGEFVENK
jgi:hypothetical protein